MGYYNKLRRTFLLPFVTLFVMGAPQIKADQGDDVARRSTRMHCKAENYRFEGSHLLLNPDKHSSQVYTLTNTGSTPLLIDHPVGDPGANAGWLSNVQPQQGSVIAVDVSPFAITCKLASAPMTSAVTCRDVLEVCRIAKAPPSDKRGTYWLAKNLTKTELAQWQELDKQQAGEEGPAQRNQAAPENILKPKDGKSSAVSGISGQTNAIISGNPGTMGSGTTGLGGGSNNTFDGVDRHVERRGSCVVAGSLAQAYSYAECRKAGGRWQELQEEKQEEKQ